MKKFLWMVLSVSLLMFNGCGSPAHKEELVNAKVGEKMMVEKLSVTVTQITRPAPNPSDPDALKSDAIVAGLLVVNESKHSLSFKLEEIYLKDMKGHQVSGYPQGGPGSLLSTGRYLAMGDKITGNLTFSIPKGATGYALYYKPAKLRGKVYKIQFP